MLLPISPHTLFGDGDEETVINSGHGNNVIPTYYFRQSFRVAEPDAFGTLKFRLLRDDGAIVYINGVEAFRSNMHMRPGAVAFDDHADGTARLVAKLVGR